ncbi:sulfotransferase domain-containing protein [Thiolapillus sp.]|uniref:sulfotransferase domain-containing protein n=2 Tax=Thiolapillus sp. TaxID=2017437 RepID=UPI0025F4138B|nr:sulfotransferase domain-containing protein [Thiolapillus sp.]
MVDSPRVSFLLIGAQKSGTTALDAHLKQNPYLCLPKRRKELHFFDTDDHFIGGEPNYEIYEANFMHALYGQLLGETTPSYMFWYSAPQRIWAYNPAMKLLMVLRNPVTRAYSHWNMKRAQGREQRSFGEAIRGEYDMCRGLLPYQCLEFSYLSRGFYCEQIRRVLSCFPKEQLLILRSEELESDTDAVMEKVWDFLKIEKYPIRMLSRKDMHKGHYEKDMSSADKDYLVYMYEYEILQLERMLGWDCSNWLGS